MKCIYYIPDAFYDKYKDEIEDIMQNTFVNLLPLYVHTMYENVPEPNSQYTQCKEFIKGFDELPEDTEVIEVLAETEEELNDIIEHILRHHSSDLIEDEGGELCIDNPVGVRYKDSEGIKIMFFARIKHGFFVPDFEDIDVPKGDIDGMEYDHQSLWTEYGELIRVIK